MTEKFLIKPPPRYIYDMLISTLSKTGFPKDLFTDEELNSKYFEEVILIITKDVKNKIEIFQKAIDITKIVLNENFEIDTKKICNID
jgi:hypothetical protein